jgi:hypothetical protein
MSQRSTFISLISVCSNTVPLTACHIVQVNKMIIKIIDAKLRLGSFAFKNHTIFSHKISFKDCKQVWLLSLDIHTADSLNISLLLSLLAKINFEFLESIKEYLKILMNILDLCWHIISKFMFNLLIIDFSYFSSFYQPYVINYS